MAKKITTKAKEPVRLRMKALADGSKSLYLDIYENGKRSYEFLRLYLIPESSPKAKVQNEATLRAANTIKFNRILELTNNKAGLKNTSVRSKQTLKDWMATYQTRQKEKGVKDESLISNTIKAISGYNFDIQMRDIDREYCIGLTDYLRNKYVTKLGKHLKPYSVINYMACLRNALNIAVREDVIAENPINKLTTQDKVKTPESKREFLTIEEVKRLEEAESPFPHIKRAFLFGCYCGLRCSDIRTITWSQITKDGEQYRLHLVMYKTKRPIYIPLSKKAMQYLPEQGDAPAADTIFKNIPPKMSSRIYLKKWLDNASITKPISFHCSRHTFATMMLTLGADIYTVSKLLGHTKVDTTQIYAKIINKKKDDAVSLIDAAFADVKRVD